MKALFTFLALISSIAFANDNCTISIVGLNIDESAESMIRHMVESKKYKVIQDNQKHEDGHTRLEYYKVDTEDTIIASPKKIKRFVKKTIKSIPKCKRLFAINDTDRSIPYNEFIINTTYGFGFDRSINNHLNTGATGSGGGTPTTNITIY